MNINIYHHYVDKKVRKLLKLILEKLESSNEQEIDALIKRIDAIIIQLKKTV